MSTSATFYVILAPQPPPPAPAVEGPVGTAEAPVTGPRDYRELVRALSPPFLARSVAARFMGLLGLVLDVVTQGAQLATLARSLYAPSFQMGPHGARPDRRGLASTRREHAADRCALEHRRLGPLQHVPHGRVFRQRAGDEHVRSRATDAHPRSAEGGLT